MLSLKAYVIRRLRWPIYFANSFLPTITFIARIMSAHAHLVTLYFKPGVPKSITIQRGWEVIVLVLYSNIIIKRNKTVWSEFV